MQDAHRVTRLRLAGLLWVDGPHQFANGVYWQERHASNDPVIRRMRKASAEKGIGLLRDSEGLIVPIEGHRARTRKGRVSATTERGTTIADLCLMEESACPVQASSLKDARPAPLWGSALRRLPRPHSARLG